MQRSAARRSTSTGRSCARSSRRARRGWPSARTRGSRSTSCCASRPRAIFARAHAGAEPTEEQALFRTVLVPLLIATAEACGGFDWDDVAFERAYAELERSLFGDGARLRGRRAARRDLGRDAGRARRRAAHPRGRDGRARARTGPRRRACCRPDFGRDADRYCVLELERGLAARRREPPDAPGELADAVTALRLATAAPVAAGPVLFERLDWRPFGIRPVLPIAATQPPGEPTRLDCVPRRRSRASCSRGSRSPTATPTLARGARPLGARRSSRTSRSAPSSCAGRSRRCSARPGRCGRPCCSATHRSERRSLLRVAAALGSGERARRRRRTRSAARSSRRCATAIARRSSASLDDELLGLRTARLARTA